MHDSTMTTVLVISSLAAVSANAQQLVPPPPMVPVTSTAKKAERPRIVQVNLDEPVAQSDDKFEAEISEATAKDDEIVRHSVYCGIFANRFRGNQVAYQPTYVGGVDPCNCAPTAFAGLVVDPAATAAVVPQAYPPQVYAPQTYPPQAYAPQAYGPPLAPQPPVILGQNPAGLGTGNPAHYIGRGIVGQPKLFVNGQPVRNALRFLTP